MRHTPTAPGATGPHATVDLKAPGPWEAPPGPGQPLPRPPGRRGRKWRNVTRLWALVKICSFGWTTWWLIGLAKVPLGTTICAYGVACFFAGLGSRWRRRWFGPGQLLEPELYEEIGTWFYRLGTVLALAGGAVYMAQSLH